MKRHGNLWNSLISMENLEVAFEKAKKHKSWQRQIKEVEKDKEAKLKQLQEMLINKTYKVSEYRERTIYEPKERQIYILPFYPDRIVQHALMNIISPIWDKMFVNDSYSCRENKGQHKASMKAEIYTVRNDYVLQCDISKFYPSINHDILFNIVKRKIKDKNVLWLIETIIRSFPGGKNAPIGNYTSQWFGNLYLHELDIIIKQKYHIKDYIRYCDDFLIFGNNKDILWNIGKELKEWCKINRNLKLSKLRLYKTEEGVDFLGYRHMKNHYVLLRKSTAKRFKKHIKELRWQIGCGAVPLDNARSSVDSLLGWMKHACTYHLSLSLGLEKLRSEIMRGLPKSLNSKLDYIHVYNHMNEEYYKPIFKALLDSKDAWFFVKELKDKNGIVDDTHKVVEDEENKTFSQYELRENPNAKIFRLGFTVEEVQKIVE